MVFTKSLRIAKRAIKAKVLEPKIAVNIIGDRLYNFFWVHEVLFPETNARPHLALATIEHAAKRFLNE